MPSGLPSSYDVVTYPSYSHPQTRPDRLGAIGALLGLAPAPANHCRVLELGCGDGSNLVPMASAFPESDFLGLDLAAQPVSRGQRMIQEAGLKNVRLLQADLSEFKDAGGPFDYIIAHGLFSWVPAPVRDRLLALCRERLAPHGIAFISYNAFPGAHLRNMVREMMLFHVRGFESPPERVQQAQSLLKFLAGASEAQDAYRLWMKAELESVLTHEPGHMFHDELAELNQPFYFTQFMTQAAGHALQYLGEADYFEMFENGFNQGTRDALKQLGSNRLLREQYLDFLKCRRFRQTLLCRQEAQLQASPFSDKVTNFFISSLAKCDSSAPDLRSGINATFRMPNGATCETDYPLGKAALAVLAANELVPTPFEKLKSDALDQLKSQGIAGQDTREETERLPKFLLQLFAAGVVQFRTHLPAMACTVSERPAVTPLMRWQIQNSNFVTSQLHTAVRIEDDVGRCLVSSLDGTLTHNQLAEKLWTLIKSRNPEPGPVGDESALRHRIELDLEKNLTQLARLGLLVG